MSQVTEYTVPGSPLTMAELQTRLAQLFAADGSGNLGASAPSNPFNGMTWIDTSEAPVWTKRIFTSEGWRPLTAVNITTGAVTPYIGDEPAERQSSPTDTTAGRLPALFDIGGGVGAIGGGVIQGGVLRETLLIPYDVDAGTLPTGFTKDSAGQVTWDTTAFSWLKFVIAEGVGEGGGGGGGEGGSGSGIGSGGGAANPFRGLIQAADLLASETLTIGGGSSNGAAAGNNTGSSGAATSLGSHMTSAGGNGGQGGGNGTGSGAGGRASSGVTTYASTVKQLIGKGTTQSGRGHPGTRVSGVQASCGDGGGNMYGAGAAQDSSNTGNANGSSGQHWGTGGCGGRSTSTDTTGGNGASGAQILYLFG